MWRDVCGKGGMGELREGIECECVCVCVFVCVCREGVLVVISLYSAVSLTQVRD